MRISLLSCLLALSLIPLLPGAPLKLTLEEAQKIALEQNPTLAQVQTSLESALAAWESARSAYLPSVDAQAGITRRRDVATRPLRDYDNNTLYEAGLSASYLVFDGFARRYRLLAARLGQDMAVADCDDARRLLEEQVSYAFYQVLQAQNTMEIRQQDAAFNRQLEEDARKKHEYGTAKLSEVLNFQYQVQSAEADTIVARNSWKTAWVALGALLSVQEEQIWENMELVPPREENPAEVFPAIGTVLDYALAHRPDLQNARREVENAELAVKEAQAQWYPQVRAFANYGFSRDHSAHFNRHYDRTVNFGLTASWNLFDGLNTQAAIRQAEAKLLSSQKGLAAQEDTLKSEVRQSYVSLQAAVEVLKKENSLLEVATRIRDLVREEYLGGTATITRLNEVQTNLTNTSLARSNAWISVLTAQEKLYSVTAGYRLP
ncbi:MAG: TolC family protein [Oligosphaeraceae bacterium]